MSLINSSNKQWGPLRGAVGVLAWRGASDLICINCGEAVGAAGPHMFWRRGSQGPGAVEPGPGPGADTWCEMKGDNKISHA